MPSSATPTNPYSPRPATGDLRVDGDPDAEQPVSPRARRSACSARNPSYSAIFSASTQRQVVVTGVVGEAGQRVEREGVGRDEVAAPDLDRVDTELVGRDVDEALEHRGRLGPPGPAERPDRRRVGQRGDARVAELRDVVDAGGHDVGRRVGEGAAETRIRATVADDPAAQPGEPAVVGQPELDILDLAAALHREHRLRPGLGGLHRAAERRATATATVCSTGARPCRRTRRRRTGR